MFRERYRKGGPMADRGRPRGFDRAKALRTAMETFWERGYDGTSIGDLTEALDIRPPSLYAAFGSKEALFREAVALYEEAEGEPTMRALRDGATARAAIENMLRANVISITDPGKPTGCMIVLAATTHTPSTAGIRDFLAEARRFTIGTIRERLARGKADGDVPRDTDIDAVATYIGSVHHGNSLLARDGVSRAELLAVVDRTMAGWEGMVGAPG